MRERRMQPKPMLRGQAAAAFFFFEVEFGMRAISSKENPDLPGKNFQRASANEIQPT